MGKEDTFLLNYGYQGCMSAIEALLSRHDVLVYDSEVPRLHDRRCPPAHGQAFVFQHNDMDSLDKQLENAKRVVEQTGGGSWS